MKIGHVNNWTPEVASLLNRLTLAGVLITAGDNGDTIINFNTLDRAAFIEHLTECDEAHLNVTMPDGKKLWMFLVLGNSPGELVADFIVHPVLEAVCEAHSKEWEGKEQPTKYCAFAMRRHLYNTRARASAAA